MASIDQFTPQELASLPAEFVARMLEADAARALRDRLRKRDAEKLQTLDDKAVGMACKLFMLTSAEEDAPPPEGMTAQVWIAYDLLLHLVYEDWSEDDGM